MAKRTQVEIEAEIARLKEMKPKVRRFSMFNDDNHAMIDAEILILEKGLSESEAYEWLSDELVGECYDVFQWRDGESADKPSDSWAPLVK